MNGKPTTPRQWALYRAIQHARIGRNGLDGRCLTPEGSSRTDWALHCMLNAIEDLAIALGESDNEEG